MAAKLRPIGEKLIVKPELEVAKTKSGIVLPDSAKEKPQEGMVIAVGSGKVMDNGQRVPLEVKVGDKVFYIKYGGSELKVDNEEYVVLSERDILAVKG